ncbi:L10-interacting MYB domain-containing protein-like [Medicago truncatula]|uniref:L10-interacting MYB domain-containing protein-like n=1 Tax=Medicago truncatula TaxID=3880 RepID=UPI001968A4D7|nr:L10-interacting MYB domain-containing protein-like [Medicago truncatula]
MTTKENISSKSENFEKAKWNNPFYTKVLLDICMDEIRKCGKPEIAFKNKKWEEIRDEFNKNASKNYTKKQLKNRMDNLRTDWTNWKQLIGKETGLGWNTEIGNIDADPAWWEAKIKENVKYAKFQSQGLKFREELKFIFGEIVTTSQWQWTPALGVPHESSGKNAIDDVPLEIIESEEDDIIPMESNKSRKKRKVSPDMGEKVTKGKTKVGTATTMRNTFERLVQAAEGHNGIEKAEIAATSNVLGQYSIPDCVTILKSAKEEGHLNNRQFSYALEMLKDEDNRIVLMSLKDSMDALVDWILYKYQ